MSENVKPVIGYSHQSETNRDLVNRAKIMEETLLRFLDDVARVEGIDPHWLAIGRTHIQQGFMGIVRGISNPQRIALPDDLEGK